QSQAEAGVIVVDDGEEGGEPSVVKKASLGVCPQAWERSSAIGVIGRPVGLEIIDADFRAFMHVPTRFSKHGLDVAIGTSGATTKEFASAGRGSRVESGSRRRRRRQ